MKERKREGTGETKQRRRDCRGEGKRRRMRLRGGRRERKKVYFYKEDYRSEWMKDKGERRKL